MLSRYTKLVPANSPEAFGIALGSVAAATVVRFGLTPLLGGKAPYILMFPAVLTAALVGGTLPGVLALTLGLLSAWYFFVPPAWSFALRSVEDVTSLGLYVLTGLLLILIAVTVRRAVARVELAQEKLVAALDASGTGTWRWDIQRDVVEWDLAMCRVFGLDPAQAPSTAAAFFDLVHPDDRSHARRIMGDAVKQGGTAEYEFRAALPNGAEKWIYDRGQVFQDADGRPVYMVGACIDITIRKRAEEQQQLLVHELNHWVKNTLATVQGLARQTLRSAAIPEMFQDAFMARLMGLAATHDILTQKLWESASITEVLAAELQPHGGLDQVRVRAIGEPIHLKPQQVLGLGMVFHELATNAVKYGALSVPRGCVEVSWTVEESGGERKLMLDWREADGPHVGEPNRRGFGTRLIERTIAHELGGRVAMKFAPSGLECSLEMPL